MPLYHFDFQDGSTPHVDEDGIDLSDLRAARTEAVRYAGELLQGQPEQFWAAAEWSLTVSDAERLTLFSLTIIATDAPVIGSRD